MRKLTLVLALGLAACNNPPEERRAEPQLAHVVDMQGADMQGGAHMQAREVIQHQNLELLYIEKVQPAVMACVRKGLVKDRPRMAQLNQQVLGELRGAKAAIDANDIAQWQRHHDIAYKAMGQMLELTGAVPYTKAALAIEEIKRKDEANVRTP